MYIYILTTSVVYVHIGICPPQTSTPKTVRSNGPGLRPSPLPSGAELGRHGASPHLPIAIGTSGCLVDIKNSIGYTFLYMIGVKIDRCYLFHSE